MENVIRKSIQILCKNKVSIVEIYDPNNREETLLYVYQLSFTPNRDKQHYLKGVDITEFLINRGTEQTNLVSYFENFVNKEEPLDKTFSDHFTYIIHKELL